MGSTSNWGALIRGACGAGLIHKAAKSRGITGPLRYFKEIQMGEIWLLNSFFHGIQKDLPRRKMHTKNIRKDTTLAMSTFGYIKMCPWFRSYYPYWNYWWSVFWHHQDLRIKPPKSAENTWASRMLSLDQYFRLVIASLDTELVGSIYLQNWVV